MSFRFPLLFRGIPESIYVMCCHLEIPAQQGLRWEMGCTLGSIPQEARYSIPNESSLSAE
jgi:hypothetical protein